MDVGPAKVRRRISAGVAPHTMNFMMTSAQIATFKTFYETTLLAGSVQFTWDHPRTGTSGEWRITKAPQFQKASGDYYTVQLDLELLP